MNANSLLHHIRWWAAVVSICSSIPTLVAQNKEIIGYYPSWKWRSTQHILTPDRIPYDKLTRITYAFFCPTPDGSLVGKDTLGDERFLGYRPGFPQRDTAGSTLVELAHRHGVTVTLSVGGWDDSGVFPAVASSPVTRANFAHSCLQLVRLCGFDGIDFDWEYPGYPDHHGTPRDRDNFTRLLRAVRDSLTSYGERIGRSFVMTAAMPAFESALRNYDLDSLLVLLDEFNVMTYDFNGPWSGVSGHNAPLFRSDGPDSLGNVDSAFRLYTSSHHIPGSRINLGVPFYGHAFANCTELGAPCSGADTVHFSSQGAFYDDIAACAERGVRHWDQNAKVPYLVFDGWRSLVSYDDSESVADKADYVLDRGAHGVIVWEITGDYMPDGTSPLLDILHSKLSKARTEN